MAIGYCEARYIHFRQQQNIEDSHDVHNRKLRELYQELGNFNISEYFLKPHAFQYSAELQSDSYKIVINQVQYFFLPEIITK